MTTITQGFELANQYLTSQLTNITIFDITWLPTLIITVFTLLIITTDIEKWKTLALPTIIIWQVIGLQTNIIIYALAVILFVLDNLSLQGMSNILETSTNIVSRGAQTAYKAIKKAGTTQELLGQKTSDAYKALKWLDKKSDNDPLAEIKAKYQKTITSADPFTKNRKTEAIIAQAAAQGDLTAQQIAQILKKHQITPTQKTDAYTLAINKTQDINQKEKAAEAWEKKQRENILTENFTKLNDYQKKVLKNNPGMLDYRQRLLNKRNKKIKKLKLETYQ